MNHPHAPPSREPAKHYETREVSVKGIVWFVAGFILTAAVLNLLLWWLMGVLTAWQSAAERPISPVADRNPTFPDPQLQPSPGHLTVPWQDLAQLRSQEENTLHSYGWVNRQQGLVRIPVDQALTLALQKGIFSIGGGPPAGAGTTTQEK